MGRPKSKNPTETVRIYTSLIKLARVIAAYEDKEISDTISEILNEPIKKKFAEVLKRMSEERREQK